MAFHTDNDNQLARFCNQIYSKARPWKGLDYKIKNVQTKNPRRAEARGDFLFNNLFLGIQFTMCAYRNKFKVVIP